MFPKPSLQSLYAKYRENMLGFTIEVVWLQAQALSLNSAIEFKKGKF